jgi:signal transduction histidine kinase
MKTLRGALQAFHCLRVRLLLTLVLAVLVALGTVAITARSAATAEFERYVGKNRQDVQSLTEQLADRVGDRLVLADSDGRIMGDSARRAVALAPLPGPGGEPGSLWLVEHPAAGVAGTVSAAPAPDGAAVPGAVTIQAGGALFGSGAGYTVASRPSAMSVSMELLPGTAQPTRLSPEDLFKRSVNRALLFAVVAGGLTTVVLAYLLSRRILGPIEALTAAARKLEAGDLDQRVALSGRDEIGQLGHAFDAMAGSLSRQNRLRRHMVTDIAHELRTPLSNVRGYLEALRDGVVEATPQLLDSVYEEAMLLSHLVDELQDLALAEAGQLSLSLQPVAVSDVLEQAVRAADATATAKGVALALRLPAGLPVVSADAKRLGQVLRNLIANALRHTPAGGQVTVAAETQGRSVRVSVCDTGEGIAPQHLPFVFERFYRADRSRARTTGGAGIGLTIVKQFVEAHGGAVEAESQPGRGTTFRFTLPLAPHLTPPRHTPSRLAAALAAG